MNFGPIIFLGVLLTFACSWGGFILAPQLQLGRQGLVKTVADDTLYPAPRSGLAQQGAAVYRSLGCASCHSQQVRDQDVPRWGARYTVAQDYLRDQPVQWGSQRVGPDLANVGARLPDANWHLIHLYNPRTTVKGSPMPRYGFLFEKRPVRGAKSPEALQFPEGFGPEPGHEIVPAEEARALVAYLLSLKYDTALFEAPMPQQEKPAEADPGEPQEKAPAAETQPSVK